MMLANHAEAPPNGLLYVSGGAWDTVNVSEPPPPDVPRGVITFIQGVLVIRLLFHRTETATTYPFRVSIMDEVSVRCPRASIAQEGSSVWVVLTLSPRKVPRRSFAECWRATNGG